MGVQVAVGIVSALVSIGLFVLIRREIRTVREALSDLRKMVMGGHGYSDPSAAAVVTEGREAAAGPGALPEPAVARAALPAVARSVVSVTRDDDPIHTRATVAAGGRGAGAPVVVPRESGTRERDETTRGRLQRIGGEERDAARRAWGEREERTAIEIPRMDGDERETPEEEELPPTSEGRAITVERLALDAEEIARVDEMAAQRGMTREEMVKVLLESGLAVLEGPKE